MSSEIPSNETPRDTSERDIALRRMLVATASAAPARPRRRWGIAAPIAAFAIAGALTGAASAAALNATEEAWTEAAVSPVTVLNMSSFVYDDTQQFGEPVLVVGQGEIEVELGTVPEGAVELALALRCADPGSFEILLDGVDAMGVTCEEDSSEQAGGSAYLPVSDNAPHTLTVTGGPGARYIVWASWVARAVPPEPSPEQAATMADGQVTKEEYLASFDRYAECMSAAGYPLGSTNKNGPFVTYTNSSEAVSSGVEGRCYALEYADVDMTWQSNLPPE